MSRKPFQNVETLCNILKVSKLKHFRYSKLLRGNHPVLQQNFAHFGTTTQGRIDLAPSSGLSVPPDAFCCVVSFLPDWLLTYCLQIAHPKANPGQRKLHFQLVTGTSTVFKVSAIAKVGSTCAHINHSQFDLHLEFQTRKSFSVLKLHTFFFSFCNVPKATLHSLPAMITQLSQWKLMEVAGGRLGRLEANARFKKITNWHYNVAIASRFLRTTKILSNSPGEAPRP